MDFATSGNEWYHSLGSVPASKHSARLAGGGEQGKVSPIQSTSTLIGRRCKLLSQSQTTDIGKIRGQVLKQLWHGAVGGHDWLRDLGWWFSPTKWRWPCSRFRVSAHQNPSRIFARGLAAMASMQRGSRWSDRRPDGFLSSWRATGLRVLPARGYASASQRPTRSRRRDPLRGGALARRRCK